MTKNTFGKASIEEFEKDFIDFLESRIQKEKSPAEENLEKGFSTSYTDNKGRWIKEYPNGKKFLIEFDELNKKIIETKEITD